MPRRQLDPEQVLVDVGRRIAELRAERELTQQQFADRAELSWKYVQQIELGYENLTLRSLVRLANLLDVTLADLMQAAKNREVRPGRPRRSEHTPPRKRPHPSRPKTR